MPTLAPPNDGGVRLVGHWGRGKPALSSMSRGPSLAFTRPLQDASVDIDK